MRDKLNCPIVRWTIAFIRRYVVCKRLTLLLQTHELKDAKQETRQEHKTALQKMETIVSLFVVLLVFVCVCVVSIRVQRFSISCYTNERARHFCTDNFGGESFAAEILHQQLRRMWIKWTNQKNEKTVTLGSAQYCVEFVWFYYTQQQLRKLLSYWSDIYIYILLTINTRRRISQPIIGGVDSSMWLCYGDNLEEFVVSARRRRIWTGW